MIDGFKKFLSLLTPTLALRDTKTVHFVFSFLLMLAVAVSVAGVTGSEAAEIILESSTNTVQTGDIFKINVYAVAKTPVNAVTLRINVPSGTVEVLGVDKGESVITLWTADPKVEGDTVILEGGTYRKGFVGKHLIATINVRAKQTGKATFITANANLLAGDGKGTVVRTDVASQGTKNLVITDKNKEIAEGVAAEVSFVIVTDINGDGEVSFADITSFMSAWTKKSVTYDFNQDGTMSFRDFSILLSDYFTGQ